MALIAKRAVNVTWREAVMARATAHGRLDECMADFESRLAAGLTQTEAAYRALEAQGLLWSVALPGDPVASASRSEPEVPAL